MELVIKENQKEVVKYYIATYTMGILQGEKEVEPYEGESDTDLIKRAAAEIAQFNTNEDNISAKTEKRLITK